MKKYITLILLSIFAIVLDVYAFKGLGAESVPVFKREFLYQSFSGTAFDWIGLIGLNIFWVISGIYAAKEKDIYYNNGALAAFTLIAVSIGGLLLIYFL